MLTKPLPRLLIPLAAAFTVLLAAYVVLVLFDSLVAVTASVVAALAATGFVLILVLHMAITDIREPSGKLPCPSHLRAVKSGRGFSVLPALPNRYGGPEDIVAYESSNAGYAGVWLKVAGLGSAGARTETTANLTAETAWRLAEQLAFLVASHYHGDQRPDPADTVLSVDMSRLDIREEINA